MKGVKLKMNKNKKIISLVAAIAMIFTMLSSFTIANAAGEGFTLSTPSYNDDGTISLTVGYTGLTSGLADGSFSIALPEEVTDVKPATGTIYSFKNNVFKYSFALGGAATSDTDGTIDTLTLTLSSSLTEAKDIKIADGSYLDANDGTCYEVAAETNALTTPTVTLPLDPNAPTPKPTTNVTPAPVATEAPSDAPVLDAPVTATSGYVFGVPSVSDDGLTVTVDVNYVGITSGLADGSFSITMPASVTEVKPATGTIYSFKNNVFKYSFALGGAATSDEAGTVDTLTLTLSAPFEYDNQLTIADGSYADANDGTCYEVGLDGVLASNVIIPAYDGDEEPKTTVGTITMRKAITVEVTDSLDEDGNSEFFIIPTVKKGTEDAVYGTDYIVKIGDTELTAAQYSNLINGYFTADNVADIVTANGITDINDVIDSLVYVLYDKSVTVAAQLVNKSTGTIENADDSTQSLGTPTPTSKPSNPSISASNVTATVNTNFDISATVLNAKTNPVVTFEIVKNASGAALADDETSAIQIYGTNELSKEVSLASGKYTQKFTANSVGTAYVKISYTDDELNDISKVIKVTVQKASTTTTNSGNGSSSSGSAGGNIATGSTSITTSPSGKIAFVDIDTVVWAQDAILRLVDLGVVNGRSDSIFDPNGTVTRAEFAKMVVLAFDLTGGAGATLDYFSDVDMTDWYAPYVVRGYYSGVISGYDDGTFRPNGLITRQEMAAMISRAISAAGKYLPATVAAASFDDAWQIGDWAYDAVTTLQQGGVIDGMGDGTFAPLDNATRAQAAVIIDRAIRYTN